MKKLRYMSQLLQCCLHQAVDTSFCFPPTFTTDTIFYFKSNRHATGYANAFSAFIKCGKLFSYAQHQEVRAGGRAGHCSELILPLSELIKKRKNLNVVSFSSY